MIGLIIIGKYLKYLDLRIWIAGGIILSIIGMWFGTKYSLDVDLWWLILPMILQGFGMGLILVPLSVIAFIKLPSSLSAEAAGLYNLLRVISSSIGIAITLTVFSRHTQIAWNHIGHFVQPYNPHFFTYLQKLHLSIYDPKAIKIVASVLARQAQMLSFVDVFAFLMWSFIIMLPLVFLLRNPNDKHNK